MAACAALVCSEAVRWQMRPSPHASPRFPPQPPPVQRLGGVRASVQARQISHLCAIYLHMLCRAGALVPSCPRTPPAPAHLDWYGSAPCAPQQLASHSHRLRCATATAFTRCRRENLVSRTTKRDTQPPVGITPARLRVLRAAVYVEGSKTHIPRPLALNGFRMMPLGLCAFCSVAVPGYRRIALVSHRCMGRPHASATPKQAHTVKGARAQVVVSILPLFQSGSVL